MQTVEVCPGRAFKAGDRAAFDRVVTIYREKLYRIAYRILRDHDEAWDISQETLIRAFEKIDSWDGKSGFYTWLYRIASNLSIDRHRRKARQQKVHARLEIPKPVEATAFEDMVRNEQLERMAKAVDGLPPAQRAMVILRHYEGLSLDDIAKVRGRALGTVKSTLFQAFRNLRKALVHSGAKEVG